MCVWRVLVKRLRSLGFLARLYPRQDHEQNVNWGLLISAAVQVLKQGLPDLPVRLSPASAYFFADRMGEHALFTP
jgi:hypothetical protein